MTEILVTTSFENRSSLAGVKQKQRQKAIEKHDVKRQHRDHRETPFSDNTILQFIIL